MLDEWCVRIGAVAATKRRARRRVSSIGWMVALAGLVLGTAGVLISGGESSASLGAICLVAVGVILVLLAPPAFISVARMYRQQMEGAAIRTLLPRNPRLTASELRPRLRSIDDFDEWAARTGINRPTADDPPLPAWSEWTPNTVRPILPGRTALAWRLRSIWLLVAGCAFAVVGGFTGLANHSHPYRISIASVIVLCLWLASWLSALGVWIVSATKARAEYCAGYSTTVTRSRSTVTDARTAVDLVDARTGYLLRPAGALRLDTASFIGRRNAVRAAHPDATPTRLP